MAAKRPKDYHEEIQVKIEQAKREVLPAVELEKKEIRLKVLPTPPGTQVPSIRMSAFENGSSQELRKSHDADRIVGIDMSPQPGEPASTRETGVSPASTREMGVSPNRNQTRDNNRSRETKRTPTSPKFGSRLTVEQTTSIIEKTENLMEFFQDHDKKGLVKRTTTKKPRTPSPSPVRQSIGLDHLDNLVRLMEQLGNLKDENSRLKHRCDYLESTKSLLQEKTRLDDESLLLSYQFEYDSLPRTTKKGKSSSTKSSKSEGDSAVRFSRPRLPSAEDAKFVEFDLGDSSSDQTPKRPKGTLFKRSFSTGSLEVPSDIMEQSGEEDLGSQHLLADPFQRKLSSKISKSPEAKRKSKFSKWAKVKKVLTKQQLSENISSGIKSIKGLGKGAYFRYGSISGRELAVPSVAESRSVDSGVGSGMDGELQDVRKSTSSNEPPSPTRFVERHIDVPTPQIDDCMGIWLGPPEWIEKEREKEQQLLRQTSGAVLSESPKSEPCDLGSPHSVIGYDEEGEQFLQIPIPRRQSSPLLLDEPDDDDEFEAQLKRTSSCKGEELKDTDDAFHKIEKGEKKHRTAWGKMKNIIHTGRKDSVKKRRKGRESDSFGFEEVSETDFEVSDDMRYDYLEGPVSRSTPKTSPVVFRQKHRDKSVSPPGKGPDQTTSKVQGMSGGSIDVSALLGGVSDEFTRKLQEWEELKGKRSSGHFKESSEFSESVSYESAGAVSPEFLKKLEEWEKVKSLKGIAVAEKKRDSQIEVEGESSSDETEEVFTPPERQQRQSINVEEIQRKLTDSFSRKMEEWERQKYRRQNSQTSELKDVAPKSSFKDRPKSKKTKEEKEREKFEKLREREVLRVEREQQKLEKERIRIEKERLKALEREAKIEKMKGRLSHPDMDSSTKFKNPVQSPLTDYKVTADFARKLHEWELMKGKEMSTAMYMEAQKRSLQFSMEYQNATNILSKNGGQTTPPTTDTDDQHMRKTSSESDDMFLMEEQEREATPPLKKGDKPSPLTLIPFYDSPEEVSPGAPVSDSSSLDDQTTDTMESMTQANILSLEKANNQLLYELRDRELEYNSLQEEVRDLNQRLVTFRTDHALELEMYKKQMIEGVPARQVVTLETRHMTQTLGHLEHKIGELKKFGEQLAMSMEGAAVGKFQTVEGEESINNRLVDLLDKMRLLLQQATKTGENTLEEVSKKSSALHNFEKLYSQAMHLQVQMNNLRLSQLERNKEIMMMKRQLLLQEANNLILQADVTRREADLLYYKEYAQKRIPIKRWNTYSGKEDRASNMPDQDSSQKQSIFQRVQRLRSIRPLTSSTTDSDSDVPAKLSPARRESPRVRKRESPKVRKKESPKTYRRESPSSRRKESPALKRRESPSMRRKDSPTTKKKESPKLQPCSPTELYTLEQSIERREEHVRTDSMKRLSGIRESGEMHFSTVTLPTAKVTLPKDISPHEMNGVPRSSREQGDSPPSKVKMEKSTNDKSVVTEKTKSSETKFPELLIPEWKKAPSGDRKHQLQRMPSVERDEVFESDNEEVIERKTTVVQTAEAIPSKKVRIQDMAKLKVDVSFDSSETSEDTLKYLSPEASPAPKIEPPVFPTEMRAMHERIINNETASDPGQSRPSSMVRVAIETPRTPVLLRRPPIGSRFQSSKLNIPVIPLKRIKPAQELLEDSQKYRSGHSIYLTRILKRYPMKIECRSRSLEDRQNADKENIKAGYVRAMVKQLSREGTPSSSKSSPILQHRKDQSIILGGESPKPEFVQHIVHKLTSPCGPSAEKSSSAFKDLTNDGQVRTIREAFANGSAGSSSDKGSDGNGRFVSVVIRSHGSQDVITSNNSSSSTSTITFSQLSTKTEPGDKPESSMSSRVIYSSMPLLSLEADGMRERSATTSNGSGGASPSHHTSYSPKDSPSQRHKIHVAVSMSPGRSRRVIDPSMSPARLRRLIDPASPGRRRRFQESSPIEQVVEESIETPVSVAQSETLPSSIEHVPLRSPKSKHKQKSEMGTIGVLCRQSMTFDLGVSIQGSTGAEGGGQGEEPRSQTLPIRHSTSSTTSTSSQSEIEATPGSSKEKKKSRNKFMDSAFIQKSKKFFRVSKESRCPSLECCGSDRELMIN